MSRLLFSFLTALFLLISIPSSYAEQAPALNMSISAISSPQKVGTAVPVTITASNNTFNGTVYLTSTEGEVSPTFVTLSKGKWTGNVTFYSPGATQQLEIAWYDSANLDNRTLSSNTFDINNASGTMPTNANASGVITDTAGQPIGDIVARLYIGDPSKTSSTLKYTTTTSTDGSFTFKNIIPGNYYFQYEGAGYQVQTEPVDIVSGKTTTLDATSYSNCTSADYAAQKVPVLLVPGIMGSKSGGIVYPRLPFISPKWNSGELKLLDPFGKVGWKTLKSTLKAAGYKEGCTMYTVPYDWSQSVPQASLNYLTHWIDLAQSKTGSKKVDIIAHSMGGIVARQYIQSNNEQFQNVRKLAFVGTPNQGSALAYYLWEGGDPILADKMRDNNLLTGIGDGKYFYTNTLFYLAKERMFDNKICEFKLFDRYTPTSCKNNDIYNFLHSEVQSVWSLMPTYSSALLNTNKQPQPLTLEENTHLKALNMQSCSNPKGCIDPYGKLYSFLPPKSTFSSDASKVQIKLFIGTGETTLQSIVVGAPNSKAQLYKDGAPNGTISQVITGDGTVTNSSTLYPDLISTSPLPSQSTNQEHGFLIKAFAPDLVNFITGQSVPYAPIKNEDDPNTALVITVDGLATPTLTTVSNDPIANATVSNAAEISSIEVPNPTAGQYQLNIASPVAGIDSLVTIMYIDYTTDTYYTTRYTTSNNGTSGENFGFGIDPTNQNTPVSYGRNLQAPENLQMTNFNGNAQLIWQDQTGDAQHDVDHYNIYWQQMGTPYYTLLGTSKQKTYLSKLTWAQATQGTVAVAAVLKSGATTAYSEPAETTTTKK